MKLGHEPRTSLGWGVLWQSLEVASVPFYERVVHVGKLPEDGTTWPSEPTMWRVRMPEAA